jgi:integrase
MRVALAPEAAALLAALEPEDRLPYAIAFYAGLRRSEIYRLDGRTCSTAIGSPDAYSVLI